jgi:hypothetical protein
LGISPALNLEHLATGFKQLLPRRKADFRLDHRRVLAGGIDV